MIEGKNIQTGAGRYYQYHGALNRLGLEVREYGESAFVFYADPLIEKKTGNRTRAALEAAGISFSERVCEDAATGETFAAAAQAVRESGAQVAVGIGGGRIIDIAKAAANMAGIRIMTVPTSAATCASYALLYVEYSPDGNISNSNFLNHEISCVLADLDYLVSNCPVRYFVSGIVDAMAKYPEYAFTTMCLGGSGYIAPLRCAMVLAEYTYKYYLENAAQAVADFQQGLTTPLVEDIISLNMMITGILSDLSVGGKSLAIAHNFYDAICRLHQDIRKEYLHGELVGMALPLQLAVNGADEEEIRELQKFLRILSVPVTLEEIGFPDDVNALNELCDYIYAVTRFESEALKANIRLGLEWLK